METLDYEAKQDQIGRFFSRDAMSASERKELLADCGCAWVFVGPYEAFDPQIYFPEMLILKYDRNGVRIYRLQDEMSSQ